MTTLYVATISANTLTYSETDKTHARFEYNRVEEDIEDYIEFYNTTDAQDAMQKIIEKCEFSTDDMIHTTVIKETKDTIYYMIHTIDDQHEKTNLNKLAMHMTYGKMRIAGSVGIYKEQINYTNNVTLSSVTMKELVEIVRSFFVHCGVIIDVDGKINEFNYIFNPIDWIKEHDSKNLRFIEFEIFDKIIIMFIELQPVHDSLNEKASIVHGNNVHGKTIFAMRQKPTDIKQCEYEYTDMRIETIDKLISVLSTSQNELKETEEDKTNIKIVNFYTILENRYLRYVSKYGNGYSTKLLKTIFDKPSVNKIAYDKLNK